MIDIKKYMSTPLEVTWDMTRRCNLSCAFCLEDSLDATCSEDVTEQTRQTIVNEIIKCKVLLVNLSGGEPLLLPRLEEYVETMTKGGCAVTITTNGLLVTKERAFKLAASGVRRVEVTVYPEVMERSFAAIDLLIKAGINVVPRAVFTRQMKDTLHKFLESCVKAGLKKLVMQEVVPQGRGMRNYDNWKLTETEVNDAINEVSKFKEDHEDFSVMFTSSTLAQCQAEGPTACVIPLEIRKRCEIRPQGNVIPCFVAIVYGIENNLLTKGLKQCWLDIPDLYKDALSSSIDTSCSTCALKNGCPGGCPAEHEEFTERKVPQGRQRCSFFKGSKD